MVGANAEVEMLVWTTKEISGVSDQVEPIRTDKYLQKNQKLQN